MLPWIIILIVCLIVEVMTVGLTSVWFAGGALVAMIVALLGGSLWLQWLLFFAVSILLVVYTRPIAAKYFNKDRLKTNAEGLVGRQAVVTQDIDNVKECGQVIVGGQEWTARGAGEQVIIPKDTVVTVKSIEGVKLYVAPVDSE